MAATLRLTTPFAYRLTSSTEAPGTDAVELHCPGVYAKFSRRCGRLLAKMPPAGQVGLVCPRCHTRTTFTFWTST